MSEPSPETARRYVMVDQSARPRDKGDDRNYGYAGALCHGCLQRARRETARCICEQRSAGVDPCASYQQSAKRRYGREEVSRAASCRDGDARRSARVDAIATPANTGAKAIRRSPAISAAKTFFSTVGRAKIRCRDAHKTAG